jgi:hypothetical protein
MYKPPAFPPPVPEELPAPPPPSLRKKLSLPSLPTVVRLVGWSVVAALSVCSALLAWSVFQRSDARSSQLRTAKLKAESAEALNLKTFKPPEKPKTQSTSSKSSASKKTTEPAAVAPAPAPAAAPAPLKAVAVEEIEEEMPALTTWPRSVALKGTPEVKIVGEDQKEGEYVYHTEHFEFVCDMPVGPDAVRHFARVFEATWQLNCQLPLNIRPQPETMRKWYRACIMSKDETYIASGAPPGSAGYYSRADKTIYVPISSLGMKLVGDKRVMLDQSVEGNHTLIHEITHQMMSRWLPKVPIWFAEGAAEYTSRADFVHGRFFLSSLDMRMREHLRRRGARNLGTTVRASMLRLPELLMLDNRVWQTGLIAAGNENYGSALLLTYYLYHLDEKRDAAGIIACLRAVESGTDWKKAFEAHVLNGRTLAKFESDLTAAYKRIGIELDFSRRGGPEWGK